MASVLRTFRRTQYTELPPNDDRLQDLQSPNSEFAEAVKRHLSAAIMLQQRRQLTPNPPPQPLLLSPS
jgi:hypothetical protein